MFHNDTYTLYLQAIASLSKLFSESSTPYLYYRVAENIFCKVFQAENLSREDLAYDARIKNIGIGIKTFVDKKTNNEKISEFNADSNTLRKLEKKSLVIKLAELRNERIKFADRTYGIHKAMYHCIARKENTFQVFETSYDLIQIDAIKNVKEKNASISFDDDTNEYSYNYSKSTLYKKFDVPQNAQRIPIEILENPLDVLIDFFRSVHPSSTKIQQAGIDYVILPLYSLRESELNTKVVSSKSGLNQWNAGGRKRDVGEVYIPVPKYIHNMYPKFFPSRDTIFQLHTPTNEVLQAKLCQENSKALMTNPNNALSNWLLRSVLNLKEGELLTYKRLLLFGIDSVKITKISNQSYKINFSKIDSYENFINEND